MGTFMGSKITGIDGKLVNVVYIRDAVGVSTFNYDFALKFLAFAKQINEGKGSETNPITMRSKIRQAFLEWAEECWTKYSNLKSEGVKSTEIYDAIHNETEKNSSATIEKFIATLEELEHPFAEVLKNVIVLGEAESNKDKIAPGSGASTSGH